MRSQMILKKFDQLFYSEKGYLLHENFGVASYAEDVIEEELTWIPAVEREEIDSEKFQWGLTPLEFVTYLHVIGYLKNPNIGNITEEDVLEKACSLKCSIDPDYELRVQEEIRKNEEKRKSEPSPRRRHPHDEGYPTDWEKDMQRAQQGKERGELTWREEKIQARRKREEVARKEREKIEQKRAEKAARGHITDPYEKYKIKKGRIPFRKTSKGNLFPFLERFKK